jgi:competence protein ComEC
MPALPRAAWLAGGAIVAAMVADGTPVAVGIPAEATAVVAIGLLVAVAVVLKAHRAALAAALLGFATVALRAALALLIGGGVGTLLPLPQGSGEWRAEVVDVSSPSGAEQRALLRVSSQDPDGADWLVYAWLPRHPTLVPGDRAAVRGSLELPPADAPGFTGFLASRGAVGTLKAYSVDLVGAGSGLMAAVERLRWAIDRALSRAIPEPEAGLAAGILIGLRERVSRAVADEFTVTGLTHVVAISGWNIALVAGIATGVLRATGLRRRARSLLVMAAIVVYTVLAGAEASVIRAALMGGVVLLAREGGRPSGAAAALGIACWGLLLADPGMIDDIGLQLSLAATAGLLALGGHAEGAVRRLTRGRAPRWFCETLGVSLAAQLSTLPLILLHFGRLSLISPLANLLVAPVVPLAMLGAVIGVLLGPLLIAPAASLLLAPLSLLAWLPLAAMVRGASLLAAVPFANVELSPPFDLLGAAVTLLAVVLALRRARPDARAPIAPHDRAPWTGSAASTPPPGRRRWTILSAALSVALIGTLVSVLVARPHGQLQVTVLDVGQGDAILVEASDGGRLLVDGGPDPDLLVRRLDERIPIWDRHIDLVVLTHPHEDHAGGLAGLVPRYSVGRIAETGMSSDGAGVRELRAAAGRLGIGRVRLLQGDAFRLGAARVDTLWPPRDRLPATTPHTGRGINDTSIVLSISIGRQRVLLTGDLEDDRDADLLEAIEDDGRRWDLLKVAHHGSATASSRPLLEALRPRLAAISVGADNDYGHPARATLDRLAAVGAAVWRTDVQGTLTLVLDGHPAPTAALLQPRTAAPCPAARPDTPLQRATARGACYARPDGGTHPSRSALPAHVHGTLSPSGAARDGRRRDSRLPRLSRHPGRSRCRPAPGRGGRAPPRHRQGAPGRSPQPSPWSRPCRCRLAQRGRPRGTGPVRRSAPGDAAHGTWRSRVDR